MSGVKIIRVLLLADSDVLVMVPASRVVAGTLPQGTTLPAISITEVSRVERVVLKASANSHCTSRIQATVITDSYPAQKALLGAMRHACRDKIGLIAGIGGASVKLDSTGPDFNDPDTSFYMQSQDFKVSYTEPT